MLCFNINCSSNYWRTYSNETEDLGRSITVQIPSDRKFLTQTVYEKSTRFQISRSKTRYVVFQHKLLFKKGLKWIEDLGRSITVRVQSERERIFDQGGIRKKYSIHRQISRSKTRYVVFQHKLLVNPVKDLFKWNEGLRRSVTVGLQCERERIFDLSGIRKKYSLRCQISRQKTRYIVFQHKLLFKLVKDSFKSTEGLGGVLRSQRGENFWPRWYSKKVLDRSSNFALKNSLCCVST